MYVPHIHHKYLTREDVDMFKQQHIEKMRELNEIKDDIKSIKPNQYEIEIKELTDENKKLKEENYKLLSSIDETDKVINDLIEYIERIDEVKEHGGIDIECKSINDIAKGVIKYEVITIPELRIMKREKRI